MCLPVDLAYLAAAPVALPALGLKSLRTGKYQSDLAGRFGFGPELPRKRPGEKRLLLHCVSVGELNSVQTLVEKLLAAEPRLRIVITTTTDTGTARAKKLYPYAPDTPLGRVLTTRFPFDFSFAVERLFDRADPDLAVLVELETWPNFLAIARSRRVPVALINGRISDKSYPRYQVIRPLMAAMLRKIEWIGAQTDTIANRFRMLGTPPDRVEVLPTLKYDNASLADRVAGQEALAAALGISPSCQLFVGGSTGPGEEIALLDVYAALRGTYPALRLAIAPRHPEVVPQVLAAITSRQLRAVRRSEHPDGAASPALAGDEVAVLDTMGELRKLYALAFAVFVGRSLTKKGGGGSDMIEVAALGKACCFGPFTANFAEVVERLLSEGTASRLLEGGTLGTTLGRWLADPGANWRAMGERAREVIRRQQGSTDHYVQKLLALSTCR